MNTCIVPWIIPGSVDHRILDTDDIPGSVDPQPQLGS